MSENPNADILQRLEFTFADRLGKSLAAAGMSSAQMSDHLGVSRNTISNWINGRTTPRRSDLIVQT